MEGAHRVLKQHLGFLTGDLNTVVNKIEILLMNQRKEYAIKIEDAKMRVLFDLQIPLFHGLVSHITPHALRMIYR